MLSVFLAIFAFLPVFSYKIRSSIIVSEFTSPNLVSEFLALTGAFPEILILDLAKSNLAALESYHPNLIFDFSESLLYQKKLKEFSIAHKVLFFSPSNYFNLYQKWVFYLHPSPQSEAEALRSLLKFLNWSDFHIVSSETERSRAIFSLLSSSSIDTLSNQVDQEVFDRHTAKVIKSSGNWKTLVLNEELGASKALKSLENNRIYKERCGLIVTTKASWGTSRLGTLAVVEEGLEEAQTAAEYEFKAILRAISMSENIVRNFTGVVSNEFLLKGLEKITSRGEISSRYSILNYKDKWRIIGDIDGEIVQRWEEIVYPGNVTEMNNSPPKISISSHTGPLNWDGTTNFLSLSLNSALQPMVSLVNNDTSILENFELELYETECAAEFFELECAQKHLDHVGLVQLEGTNPTAIELNLRFLKENNIKIPHIGLVYNNQTIFDKTLFPEVLVTLPSFLFWYSILPYIIKSFGWDQLIAIFNYYVEPDYKSIFLQNSESINLNVLNTEEEMFIPSVKTENYYKEVEHIVEFIHKSKCKIVMMMVDPYSHLYFIEALYDFGFRRGDLVLIYRSSLAKAIDFPEEYNFDRKKVLELVDGSISVSFAEYIGDYGQELQKTIASLIYPNSTGYTCLQIDSLLFAARTIDLMIRNGRDFEDFDNLMFFMRTIQFTGCSGRLSIDSTGNGRRDILFLLNNFYMTGENWNEAVVGSYSQGVMVPLKLDRAILWPNGITDVPDDTIYEPKCGFRPEMVTDNAQSRNLSMLIIVALFSFVCIICILLWRHCFYFKRDFLTEKREMYFEDGVLLYLPILEALQFLALGPSFYQANYYLTYLCAVTIFDFDKVIDFEEDFWILTSIGLGACTLWCISLCITLCEKEKMLPRLFRDLFDVIGYKFIQVFCQLCFVSLNVLALKLFECKQGIGDNTTDSFLKYDCRTSCWEGKHLFYVIGACVVLVCFNLFAMVCRVISDDLMEYVNVNTQPTYAFWKGVFQLILITLNFHLKDDYEIIFGVVYCSLFVCWCVFVLRTDSHNYGRLNRWVKVITTSVCTHEILILGYILLGIPRLVVIILQATIFVLCSAIGLYGQFTKTPSMLYKRKGRNFDKLLRFTFTRKVKAKELTEHEIDYVKEVAERYEIE